MHTVFTAELALANAHTKCSDQNFIHFFCFSLSDNADACPEPVASALDTSVRAFSSWRATCSMVALHEVYCPKKGQGLGAMHRARLLPKHQPVGKLHVYPSRLCGKMQRQFMSDNCCGNAVAAAMHTWALMTLSFVLRAAMASSLTTLCFSAAV